MENVVETTYECRGCGKHVYGFSDGRICEPGWGRIIRIDGPNTICPACIHDRLDDVLNSFREDGYERAEVVHV
jgi:ribosomal protein L37E